MRTIEEQMVAALKAGRAWSGGNTIVTPDGTVFLHGNRIAYVSLDRQPNPLFGSINLVIDLETFHKWPTVTTRSRLNALGLNYPYVKLQRGRR